MSVKLRLRRMGNTNRPFYRVVAIDSRRQRDGRAIEELGYYDPLRRTAAAKLDEERVLRWLARGAQPSPTVRQLLKQHGLLEKWVLLKQGTSPEEATRRVAERLQNRVEVPRRRRPKPRVAAEDTGS